MLSTSKVSHWRTQLIYLLFVGIVLIVVGFLFRWQILEYDRFRVMANQRVKDSQLASLRGSILSADGSPLAYSVPVYDLFAYLPEIEYAEELKRQTRDEFITKVSKVLKMKEDDLKSKFATNVTYVVVAREISTDQKKALEKLKSDKFPEKRLEGLHFEPAEKRIYPDSILASHIVGFVGKNSLGENVGRNGVEGYWNGDLAWKRGVIVEETDSFGNQILTGKYEPVYPKLGRTVRLTIDRGLQRIVEKSIKEGVKRFKAKSGTIIIMDPRSGKVEAMANYPTYNPNKYDTTKDYEVFRNKAVADPYEFGSVGKCFTASAAIELDKVTPDKIIFKHHDGCVHVLDDKEICTSSKDPAGPMDMTDVLAYSDNIGAYMIAKKVGADDMYKYLRKFGIGSKTNVGLGEETTSFLKTPEKWNLADVAAYSYGQGYSATPMQIISALSAIPNKGVRMQPFIVSKVYDEERNIEVKSHIAGKPIKKGTAMVMNEVLTEVFDRNGSKWQFKELVNYKLAGKSGTASVLDENGLEYAKDKVNVTYVGWDSSKRAKFIMLVKLQEPAGAPFSVDSAQPLWMDTFFKVKDHLGVVPIVEE